jgi:3D (Asp-Asp-Asp) domain-containing protein
MKNIKKTIFSTMAVYVAAITLMMPFAFAETPGDRTLQYAIKGEEVKTSHATSEEPSQYKKSIDIVATAYAPGPHDNGKWGNLTHIGTKVRPGIIAVDPRVIPLGSSVYIKYPDGHGVYAVAEDTGGAIKGNRIDIAVWTVAEAYQFGIQNVKVYVL